MGEEAGSLQLKLKTELRCTGKKEKVMTFHCRSQTLVNLLASQKNTTQQPDRVNYIAIADWPLRCTTSRVPQFHWTGIPSDSEDKNQPQRCSDVVCLSGSDPMIANNFSKEKRPDAFFPRSAAKPDQKLPIDRLRTEMRVCVKRMCYVPIERQTRGGGAEDHHATKPRDAAIVQMRRPSGG